MGMPSFQFREQHAVEIDAMVVGSCESRTLIFSLSVSVGGYMKIMGTGSRSMITALDRQAIYDNLEARILQLAHKYPDLQLISGMAEGWDEAIAKVGMRNHIPYAVILPNKGYGRYYWEEHSLLGENRGKTFTQLCGNATRIEYVCTTLYANGLHSNFVRNQRMVDLCDMALVFNPQSSGTRDAVARLRTANKPFEVAPFTLQEELEL
jgi:hypothetical protein